MPDMHLNFRLRDLFVDILVTDLTCLFILLVGHL